MCEVLDYRENKGRTEGITEEKRKVALQLKKRGFDDETIREILESDEDELRQLLSTEA